MANLPGFTNHSDDTWVNIGQPFDYDNREEHAMKDCRRTRNFTRPAEVGTVTGISLGLALGLASLPVHAQDLLDSNASADPAASLSVGFSPDPFTRRLTAGGDRSLQAIDANCAGFVDSDNGIVFSYEGNSHLGVFVSSAADTTLLLVDSNGQHYCSDDHEQLPGANPGVSLANAPAGNFTAYIGTLERGAADATATLAITEYGPSMWAQLDLDGGFDDLVNAIASSAIDFGDDAGAYANDGECDDPRFFGDGSAMFPSDDHEMHDASDCQVLYGLGEVVLIDAMNNSAQASNLLSLEPTGAGPLLAQGGIDFGNNSSTWANDGECDDPRFQGEGMAAVLSNEDRGRDANDCRTLFQAGRIRLSADSISPRSPAAASIDFGDDSSTWANDGECDDPRFQGEGMASTTVAADIRRDASDCRSLFQQGSIELLATTDVGKSNAAGIDFGDDSSTWANDGECDDPRFEGNGMAFSTSEEDIRRDASDCRSLFQQGSISLVSSVAAGANSVDSSGIDFGDDSGNWALDGECDDPRFSGDGMALSPQDSDIRRDASDCRSLFQAGSIQLAGNPVNTVSSNAGLIDFGDNSSNWANDGECDDPRFEGDGMANVTVAEDTRRDANDCRSLFESGSIRLTASNQQQLQALLSGNANSGTLASGDAQGINGGYADNYSFQAAAGESAIIDLRSDDFDTYLRVTSPSGQILSNDDFQASTSRSVVNIPSTEAGQYQVEVTSFGSSESGAYSLQMNSSAATVQAAQQSYNGRLENGDLTLQSGEYHDSYSFEGNPGQRVSIDLRSDDFDTYVILVSPSGEQEENDDANGTNSQLVVDLTEQGSYEVWVTSYSEGETGSYQLEIANGDSGINGSVSADVNNLSIGESLTGNLSSTDSRAVTDGPEDAFVFYGEAGESVIIDLESGEFDTYLTLITPDGEHIENDDFQSSLQQSQVSLSLPQTGRYRVIVSSYGGQGLGDYLLSVRAGSSGSSIPGGVLAGGSGGQIYGLFVGVADYPGTDSDLPLTDQDAQRARDALIQGAGMNPGNATTLLNSDATRANFSNALDRIAASAGSDDTLVIFYSGHGSRLPRSSGYDSRDPDGYDETMVLYDDNLLDDELAAMLDAMDVGKVLLVMDSCFSGGFAKDIVSRPGRMGMFSSEEDVLSQVAMKFQAGGYLSYFFEEALTQRYADRDNNGEITAIELSQYLHQRFDTDVKSFGTDDYVRAQGPQASYQKLVIDRGGIGPYNVLFTRQ
jgi:hypothetical protein